MPPGNTMLEAHKSSGKMIWTNRVRLKGCGTGKCRNQTREEIDKKLIAAGWVIQDKKRLNLYESLGVAVREMINIMNIVKKGSDPFNSSVPTAKLMEQVARGDRHSETLRALGNRMIRLDLKLNEQQHKRVHEKLNARIAV